jgi:hypothetical protein
MTTDFKLRNGHRTRALLHAVSLINAQACKPLYERRALLLSDIVHCAYQIGAIASERYKTFAEFSAASLTEQTSELEIVALASHLLGYVEIAQTYRSVWGVWLDHCSRPGFLTFQVPEGAKNRQPMAGEILSFKRLSEGGQGGSSLIPSGRDALLGAVDRSTRSRSIPVQPQGTPAASRRGDLPGGHG